MVRPPAFSSERIFHTSRRALASSPRKERGALFQRVGVQFQEGDYQPEIKVFELCEEIACLYNHPGPPRPASSHRRTPG